MNAKFNPGGVFFAILVTCLLAGGCGRSATTDSPANDPPKPTAQAPVPAKAMDVGDFVVGEPIRHKNLTVFPVLSKTPRDEDRFITLSEGLKAGTVEISEIGAGMRSVPNSQRQNEPSQRPAPSADDDPFSERQSNAMPREPDVLPAAYEVRSDVEPDAPASDPFVKEDPDEPAATQGNAALEAQEPSPDPFANPPSRETPDPVPNDTNATTQVDSDFFSDTDSQEANADPFGSQDTDVEQDMNLDQGYADVNRLTVVNRSEKPLYLMPGEIIYGGQQDRTIAEEAIIPSDAKPVAIKVYCVEHGRWGSRAESQTAEEVANLADPSGETLDAAARQKLAAEANQGKFVAQAGSLGKGGRVAVHDDKGQQEVWNKVGLANASSGMTTDSDTFTANYTSPEMLKQLEEYMQAFQSPVADQKQVVGAIVAINGKVEAVDVFQSTPLFRKLWPVLLKSYSFDAATAEKPKTEAVCTLQDAREFLQATMQADVEKKSNSQGGLVVTKRDAKNVVSFSAGESQNTMGGMGGFGGAVHSSGFSK